jgi:hypothetical protein
VGTGQQPPSEAATDWLLVKDTTNTAALDAFIRRHGGSFEAELAQVRIDELRRQQTAAVRPPAPPPSKPNSDGGSQQASLGPGSRPESHLPKPHRPGESCSRRTYSIGVDIYCATSVLGSQLGNQYGVRNLFDGNNSTAWVEGSPGHGVGEWITIEFDKMRLVNSITVNNGYQKNQDIFYKNSRVRQLSVVFSQSEKMNFSLQDRFGAQSMAYSVVPG